MKNLVKGFLMLTLVVLMASCADKNTLIAKTWVLDLTEGKSETKEDDKKKKGLGDQLKAFGNKLASNAMSLEFKSDGTFEAGIPFLGAGAKAGKWKIEGNTLKLTAGEKTTDVNIVKLSGNQLVLGTEGEKQAYFKPKGKE